MIFSEFGAGALYGHQSGMLKRIPFLAGVSPWGGLRIFTPLAGFCWAFRTTTTKKVSFPIEKSARKLSMYCSSSTAACRTLQISPRNMSLIQFANRFREPTQRQQRLPVRHLNAPPEQMQCPQRECRYVEVSE